MADAVNGSGPTDNGSASSDGAAREGGQSELLTPGEVASLFGVDPKTVTRWATAGKLNAQRTLGGHRRYHAEEIYALLDEHGASGRVDAGG